MTCAGRLGNDRLIWDPFEKAQIVTGDRGDPKDRTEHRGTPADAEPSICRELDPSDAQQVLRLFEARRRLGLDSSEPAPQELTPSPMVLAVGRPILPPPGLEAEEQGLRPSNPLFNAAYFPPKTPPGLEAIVVSECESVRVAPEYDPKAPTRRRLRRPSTVPPRPSISGRLLIPGLLIGGLFVALVMVVVQRLIATVESAPSSDRPNQALHSGPVPAAPVPAGQGVGPGLASSTWVAPMAPSGDAEAPRPSSAAGRATAVPSANRSSPRDTKRLWIE